MPNIKAAIKWTRQSEKRTKRNLGSKTRLKTLFKKARSSDDAGAVSRVESEFDKAASKGIIHPNKAARKKSRLAQALRAAAAPKIAKAKTARGPAKKSGRKAGARKTTK